MAFDRRETATLLLGDFLILVVSFWAALALRNLSFPSWSYFETNVVPFLPMLLLSLFVFYIAGLYEKQTRPIRRVMGVRILGAQAATVVVAAVLFFILPLTIAPKTILVFYLIISVVAESYWRFYRMNRELKDGVREPATLFGSGTAAQELYDEINENNRYLIRFSSREDDAGPQRVEVRTSDRVVVTGLAALYEEIFDRVPLDTLDTTQFLISLPRQRMLYDLSKRVFDIALASALSFIAVPLIGVAALLLVVSGGSPFIWNERVGKDGRTIRILKLRSMLFNDRGDTELQKKNRVTGIGRLLRKTRIDELPQLWNILRGDISFIGPRPELPQLVEAYKRELPQYHLRHLITPGLSGWAQIHDYDAPRGGVDVPRTRRKLSFDLYYLKHRSFGLDLAIALKTLRALVSFSGT